MDSPDLQFDALYNAEKEKKRIIVVKKEWELEAEDQFLQEKHGVYFTKLHENVWKGLTQKKELDLVDEDLNRYAQELFWGKFSLSHYATYAEFEEAMLDFQKRAWDFYEDDLTGSHFDKGMVKTNLRKKFSNLMVNWQKFGLTGDLDDDFMSLWEKSGCYAIIYISSSPSIQRLQNNCDFIANVRFFYSNQVEKITKVRFSLLEIFPIWKQTFDLTKEGMETTLNLEKMRQRLIEKLNKEASLPEKAEMRELVATIEDWLERSVEDRKETKKLENPKEEK